MPLVQVDLMCLDSAVTVYDKTDSVKDNKGKERKFIRPSKRSMDELKAKFDKWDDSAVADISGFNFGKG